MRIAAMPTIADSFFRPTHRQSSLLRDAAMVIAGSAIVAISAKIQIPGPIPFTMQPLAVILIGAALGSRRGGLALLAYLVEGFAGFPVFAGSIAGPGYFAGQTAGYLIAFPVAAFAVGWLAERGWDRRFVTALAALAVGDLIILTVGAAWLSVFVGFGAALSMGVVPFLAGDVLKILLAAMALPGVWRIISKPQRGTRNAE